MGPLVIGPVHLLPTSAAEVGFVWDGEQQGWIHFQGAIFVAWQLKISAQLADRKG